MALRRRAAAPEAETETVMNTAAETQSAGTEVSPADTAPEEKETKAVKAAEKKKAAPKKTAAKKTEEKTDAKKTGTKKTAVKKSPARKAAGKDKIEQIMVVQFRGREISAERIHERFRDVWTKGFGRTMEEVKSVVYYVKPEDSAVYFVVNDDPDGGQGSFEI